MATLSHVSPDSWVQYEDTTAFSRVTPDEWWQLATGGSSSATFSAGGTLAFSGTNTFILTNVLPPSGGVTFSGTNDLVKTKVMAPSGTVVFSGTAPFSSNAIYTITPTGGVAYSGTNLFINTNTFATTGSIVFSGVVEQIHTKTNEPSGLIAFTGTNGISFIPAGGALLSTRLPMTGAGTT